jgi:hypothetical protein
MLALPTLLVVVRLQPMSLMRFSLLVAVSVVHLMLLVSVEWQAKRRHAVSANRWKWTIRALSGTTLLSTMANTM